MPIKRFLFLELDSPPPFFVQRLSKAERRAYDLAFISERSAARYLKVFERFDEQQRMGVNWHWAAWVMTLPWLWYRRRYLDALVYVMVGWSFFQLVLVMGWVLIGFLLGESALVVQLVFSVIWVLLFIAVPALFADAYLYRVARREIADVVAEQSDPDQIKAQIRRLGSTSNIALLSALLIYIAALVGFREQVWPMVISPWQNEMLLQASEAGADLLMQTDCDPLQKRVTLMDSSVTLIRSRDEACQVVARVDLVPFYFNQAIEGSTLKLTLVDRGGFEQLSCRSLLKHQPAQTRCEFG